MSPPRQRHLTHRLSQTDLVLPLGSQAHISNSPLPAFVYSAPPVPKQVTQHLLLAPGQLPDPQLFPHHPSTHAGNVLTSAGLVVQGTPQQDGVHQLLLCFCSLKSFCEGQIGDLGAEAQHEEQAENSPAQTGAALKEPDPGVTHTEFNLQQDLQI